MVYEFFLPNVDFGGADQVTEALPGQGIVAGQAMVRDKIAFLVQQVPWTLRRLFAVRDNQLPSDAAYLAVSRAGESKKLEATKHCCLQVATGQIDADQACAIADDICWLLQLPLGQKVSWSERGIRQENGYQPAQRRSVQVAERPNRNGPIRNNFDGALKRFMEGAYPRYMEDCRWWRTTLDWVAIAYDSSVIQVAGLICSMLLERVPRFLLKSVAFPPQIDKDLKVKIGKGQPMRSEVVNKLNILFGGLAGKWPKQRGDALIEVILGWNAEPSYMAKIRQAFEVIGMDAPPKMVLENRNSLAHKGELEDNGLDPGDYYKQVIQAVTAALLRMLSYKGKYFSLGVGEAEV